MATMLRDIGKTGKVVVNVDALKSEVRQALINQKVNACPIAVRLAWHAAGTYDRRDGSGGCNGGRMRFDPESTDPDNAGLSIVRDLLHPVKQAHPEISHADLYAIAGCMAIEFMGGPAIPFRFGRSDEPDGRKCPANGRLPDAKQGAPHLRDVFGRMGFDDRDIVALSGAHTLGRCHSVRSGFDGPWTAQPLKFDNVYFVNLVNRQWRERKWDGPRQFEDVDTGKLMMLPTDMALMDDPKFKKLVEAYAADQDLFFRDFSRAFAKLITLGCPAETNPFVAGAAAQSEQDKLDDEFRELAMHGSVAPARKIAGKVNVQALEPTSGRSALHKAAFWGHNDMVKFLLEEVRIDPNLQDVYGETALHDAAKFGHETVVKLLLKNGARTGVRNAKEQTPRDIAQIHGKKNIFALLQQSKL